MDAPKIDLSFSDFKRLTDQFDVKWANLTGEGDAFLNHDYMRMIRYLKSRGTSVYLTDSMDLVTPDKSEELVRLGVDGIYISMDAASRETYEAIKVGCKFERTLANIKGLLAAKRKYHSPIPEICFRYTITQRNVTEIPAFIKLTSELATREEWGDGSKIHFIGLLDYPAIHHLYLDRIPNEVVREAVAVQRSLPKAMPIVFAHLDEERNPSINTCLAWLEPYFALTPKPMMLPCCAVMMANARDKLAEYSFGDYTKAPTREIWNSPYYRWFRQTVTNPHAPVPFLCVGCRAYDTKERIAKYGVDTRKAIA